MSLLFVPLTTVAMDPIPRERMGNATSLFNLMRNIGGSVGIAITGTMLARNQQATTALLGAHVTPTIRRRRRCSRRCRPAFMAAGADAVTATNRAYAALFGMVQRQATMVSFVELFQLLGLMFLALIPLVLLMKRPRQQGGRSWRTNRPLRSHIGALASKRRPVSSLRPVQRCASVALRPVRLFVCAWHD